LGSRILGVCTCCFLQFRELPFRISFLATDLCEATLLFKDLLIGVTGFFREPEAFEVLEQEVIPKLVRERAADAPFRVWVPGCATGEEAYSIAMLLMVAVPLLADDEFARIAAKTNEMIQGLKERDICQVRFGRYVSPEISRRILNGEISADGELVEATILFCDLRGYTSFVEKKSPTEVVRFMNRYFTEMEHAVRDNGGIVLQYIGDEIEAVFGTPAVPSQNHSERAVSAALAMRAALEQINEQRRSNGESEIRHGVGVHCGTVLAGNVGSPERLVYAMVGDAVNVASRLQVLNKTCGTDILVSRNVVERLSGLDFRFESMGAFPIRGKTEQIEVFSVSARRPGQVGGADAAVEEKETKRSQGNGE